MSDMTKSAVMVKPLRAFKVVVGFESSVVKGELPGRIDKGVSKQGRTTLGHTGRFSGKTARIGEQSGQDRHRREACRALRSA